MMMNNWIWPTLSFGESASMLFWDYRSYFRVEAPGLNRGCEGNIKAKRGRRTDKRMKGAKRKSRSSCGPTRKKKIWMGWIFYRRVGWIQWGRIFLISRVSISQSHVIIFPKSNLNIFFSFCFIQNIKLNLFIFLKKIQVTWKMSK